MILLPGFEKFLEPGHKYSTVLGVIHEANELVDEYKHGDANGMFTNIPEEHLMSYAIAYKLLEVYHSWLTSELASPDTPMWATHNDKDNQTERRDDTNVDLSEMVRTHSETVTCEVKPGCI